MGHILAMDGNRTWVLPFEHDGRTKASIGGTFGDLGTNREIALMYRLTTLICFLVVYMYDIAIQYK
jgi:hypothetical protein